MITYNPSNDLNSYMSKLLLEYAKNPDAKVLIGFIEGCITGWIPPDDNVDYIRLGCSLHSHFESLLNDNG